LWAFLRDDEMETSRTNDAVFGFDGGAVGRCAPFLLLWSEFEPKKKLASRKRLTLASPAPRARARAIHFSPARTRIQYGDRSRAAQRLGLASTGPIATRRRRRCWQRARALARLLPLSPQVSSPSAIRRASSGQRALFPRFFLGFGGQGREEARAAVDRLGSSAPSPTPAARPRRPPQTARLRRRHHKTKPLSRSPSPQRRTHITAYSINQAHAHAPHEPPPPHRTTPREVEPPPPQPLLVVLVLVLALSPNGAPPQGLGARGRAPPAR
jgi:hypothetical protein